MKHRSKGRRKAPVSKPPGGPVFVSPEDQKRMSLDTRISVTPHVAQNTACPVGSAINGCTTYHEGYAKSFNARRGIEKVFGWIKASAAPRQFKVRGIENVKAVLGLHVIAYNLICLGNLLNPAIAST